MPATHSQLVYHVVFSTKLRSPLITNETKRGLYSYVAGIVRSDDGTLIDAGGGADHVHLLLRLPTSVPVADAVRKIKANTTNWYRRCHAMKDFAWQAGYGAFSVSWSRVPELREYFARQEEHHRGRPVESEMADLLNHHNLQSCRQDLVG
jgi:REP element-mobilizing transposase RayT